MFHVRWKPTTRPCTNCGASGRYHYSYNTEETECRACDGKGTIYLSDVAKAQAKVRKALMGQLKKDGMEPAGMDADDFELWERKPRAEGRPTVARRKRTAPVLYSAIRFAEIAAGVAVAVNALLSEV